MKKNQQPEHPGQPPAGERHRRYPEEDIIDALEKDAERPQRAGRELAEHFGAVTGKAGQGAGKKD